MGDDRLEWIFDGAEPASLEARYDSWAATYDADHDEWGWRGPDLVAAAIVRHLEVDTTTGVIVDAGCGTGMAGTALRAAGWRGRLVGLDLSRAMLDEAARCGAYDALVKCSLYDIPLAGDVVVATVSSGVFTEGHVGGDALAELCRITESGGVVSVTQRTDLADEFVPYIDTLCRSGEWEEIARTAPARLHPDRTDTEQTVVSWRVRAL